MVQIVTAQDDFFRYELYLYRSNKMFPSFSLTILHTIEAKISVELSLREIRQILPIDHSICGGWDAPDFIVGQSFNIHCITMLLSLSFS